MNVFFIGNERSKVSAAVTSVAAPSSSAFLGQSKSRIPHVLLSLNFIAYETKGFIYKIVYLQCPLTRALHH